MIKKISEYYGLSAKAATGLLVALAILWTGVAVVMSSNATARQMPDLTERNYKEVNDYYTGIIFSDQDNLGNRVVLSDKNWKICRQSTPAGSNIGLLHSTTVYVVKLNEDCSGKGNISNTATKQSSEPLSVRICKDLGVLSVYQVLTKYNTFLKDKGNPKAMAETLYGNVALSCPEKFKDDSNGIYYFIASWAPEIFGSN